MIKDWYKRIRNKLRKMDERTKKFDQTLAEESWDEGRMVGLREGRAIGKAEGRIAGHNLGYEQGYQDGRVDMAVYMTKEA